MKVHEYYDWNHLITRNQRSIMCDGINELIAKGNVWTNSPKYQTNVNIFGLPTEQWTNLKMSFIWSCFAFMKQERQIKNIQSWSYRKNCNHDHSDTHSAIN